MLPDEEITAETLFLVDDLDRPSSVRNNLNKVEKKIAAPALGVLEQLSEIVTLSPELTDRLFTNC